MNIWKYKPRVRKVFKFIGGWLVCCGLLFLGYSLFVLFDPEATVRINGEETKEFGIKLLFTIFSLVFTLIGLFFAFMPKCIFNKVFEINAKLATKIGNQ